MMFDSLPPPLRLPGSLKEKLREQDFRTQEKLSKAAAKRIDGMFRGPRFLRSLGFKERACWVAANGGRNVARATSQTKRRKNSAGNETRRAGRGYSVMYCFI